MRYLNQLVIIMIFQLHALAVLEGPGVYGPESGDAIQIGQGVGTHLDRVKQMEALLAESETYRDAALEVLPQIPAQTGDYYLDGGVWTKLEPAKFKFKQAMKERLSGGGRLVSGTTDRLVELNRRNPVFLFQEDVMDDPPCIVPLAETQSERVIWMEKVVSNGAWVRRSDWERVRLTRLNPGWYLLEVASELVPGEYALCHNMTVVPFTVTPASILQEFLLFERTPENHLNSRTKSRFADLEVPDSCFAPDDNLNAVDQKNGFQDIILGSAPPPANSRLVQLPNIGKENYARTYDPVLGAFRGRSSITVKSGRIQPGKEVLSTEYFMGGMGRAQGPQTNVWLETVRDPRETNMLTGATTVEIYPNDVDVYALEEPRTINGVEVAHIGLNYIAGRLAGIVMQYNLDDERDIIQTYNAAYGKGRRDSRGRTTTWTGKRVRIEIRDGYIRYSSLPVLHAIAGFLPNGKGPSKTEALDSL